MGSATCQCLLGSTLDIPDDTQLRPVNSELLKHHEAALNSCVAAAGVLQPSLPGP